jgi:peptide deformylase
MTTYIGMSFPWIMVRVHRHRSISITFEDDAGVTHAWNHIDTATSELLQHEIDHLDGILATDIADGTGAIISRQAYDTTPDVFHQQVDYYIVPTITPSDAAKPSSCDKVSTSTTSTA